jgi:hypothetical protein
MWFVYIVVALAIATFSARKWGRYLYHRFGRPIYLRRLLGAYKTRAPTPPLEERRLNNEYSVFQVYDDGSIISSRIEKPQTVMCTL